ncbi:MAG: valine--tRNA ligase [Anaerolineales bacterium]|nr:valine--tRNA ligase [Anaerolineales bacterium]
MENTMLPKTFDFKAAEARLYKFWEEKGYFKPTNDPNLPDHDPKQKPYVISIPPPNVTGKLHLGHVLFVTLEDLMIRHQRMKGVPTLWVPGTDHAGIATQLQVEMKLKEEGTSREEIGREKFLEETWNWKNEHSGLIVEQIRRLGASCDWDRERFTLDEGLSRAVREAFVHLYEKGLIYRGPRLINWSPTLQTAVSDLEVEHTEEQGNLYYFKYQLAEDPEQFIPVATTRPETILGDTAVAVHPEDERYQEFIGKTVLVPILGREIPVIGDEYVSTEFGTGALKITPGHDPNDYQIGLRHNLDLISMLDKKAKVTEVGGPYQGQDRFVARENLWQDMKKAGLVIKEEPYIHQIPRAQRGGEIIEPMISTQWFVDISPLAEKALEAVKDGRIEFIPERFKKVYYNWMENIHDWCISRQLWWGHRIPVWYCADCNEITVARQDPTTCEHCGSSQIQQDPDVLDTWFSSGLWPFSTLGWPEKTPDLEYFYPTTMMETGTDILFFWVARMIMMGLELTDKIPFSMVYLHGLVMDEEGQKMSRTKGKTKGKVIDPIGIMDEMGTDALRFTMMVGSTPGQKTNLSLQKVEANRNFANKMWNAGRFVLGTLEHAPKQPEGDPDWTLADSWIWAKLQDLIRNVDRLFNNHQYGEAGRYIYEFFWGEYADWYLEIAKEQISQGGDRAYYTVETLIKVLDMTMRMLHPFTPYITEELWQHLKDAALNSSYQNRLGEWPDALMIAPWPEPRPIEDWEAPQVRDFELIQDIVRTIRNLRAEKGVKPGRLIPALFVAGNQTSILRSAIGSLSTLAYLDQDQITILETQDEKPRGQIALVAGPVEIYLPLSGLVDLKEEEKRLSNELAETENQIKRLEELLSGAFTKKAPENVVNNEKDKLAGYRETAATLKDQLYNLKDLP